jgi:hypothetical protein
MSEIYDIYDIFKSKLSNLSKKTQIYYNNVSIIECGGDKCRLHANHFTGIHCESCYGDLFEIEPEEIDEDLIEKHKNSSVTTFECHGSKCRIHGDNGSGFHCESCYEPWEDH